MSYDEPKTNREKWEFFKTELSYYIHDKIEEAKYEAEEKELQQALEREKAEHQEYLENKAMLDDSKAYSDYKQSLEKAENDSNDASKNYVAALKYYIDNGTEYEKKCAKALLNYNNYFGWLVLLLVITGGFFVAMIMDAESVLTVIISLALFTACIAVTVKTNKNAITARDFFMEKNKEILNMENNVSKTYNDVVNARKELEVAEKVEKYEKDNS